LQLRRSPKIRPCSNVSNAKPERRPFWIITRACVGQFADGRRVLRTHARFDATMTAGHFADRTVLGPVHLSRALAQSGMLLTSLAAETSAAVPEVVAIKRLTFDHGSYQAADSDVVTEVICERVFTRGGRQFANVRGSVWVNGAPRLETDQFTYVLIPRAEHPGGGVGAMPSTQPS